MFEDLIREMDRLAERWAARAPLAEEADLPEGLDLVPPRRAEGADGSGTVHVTIGADVLPESITVDPGWRRGVGSERFSDAVLEAYENAVTAQLTARLTAPMVAPDPDAMPPRPVSHDPEQIGYQELTDLPIEMATGTGTAAYGKVVVALAVTGLRSVTAEPEWLARQSDDELMEAVGTALAGAHADLIEASARR
jgi:DNA-binding protein YbaB